MAGMATSLGFRAAGIEISSVLAAESREALATHGLDVEIAVGSFLPEDYEIPPALDAADSQTIQEGADGYGGTLGRDIDEFDVVFAYPWPGMDEVFCHLFDNYAAPGACLVTYHGLDGCRVQIVTMRRGFPRTAHGAPRSCGLSRSSLVRMRSSPREARNRRPRGRCGPDPRPG